MIIGTLLIEIKIEDSRNLKDKRRMLKSIIEKLEGKFNVSFAEMSNNDVVNYASLCVSIVLSGISYINSAFNRMRDLIGNKFNVYIVKFERNSV